LSLPHYRDYRPSGVEWLGDVPAHWDVRRLKYLCRAFASNVDKHSKDGETPVRLCNYTHVYYNDVITTSLDFMKATATADEIARFSLRAGDVLITKDSETADDIAVSAYVPDDLPGVLCGYHLSMLRPGPEVSGRYIKYLFDAAFLKAAVEVAATGLTRVALGQSEIDALLLPRPPLGEQIAIALFLDRETAKLDALVAEQEHFKDLLSAKRERVISHAVTKGLRGSPLSPSGVSWLGDVPAHWELGPIKRWFRTCSGSTPDTTRSDHYYTDAARGTPWIRTMDLPNGSVQQADVFITDAALADTACSELPKGSVLVAMYGGEGTIGKNGLLEIPAAVNQAVCAIRPSSTHTPLYLLRYIQFVRPYWMIGAESTRKAQNISQEQVRSMMCLRPPLAEQVEIAEFLSAELGRIDALEKEVARAIDLFRQRRASLITTVVTGQVDVRSAIENEAA
jgi:type I restriction enzyme, S subunit